jgi:hypothetical protein
MHRQGHRFERRGTHQESKNGGGRWQPLHSQRPARLARSQGHGHSRQKR